MFTKLEEDKKVVLAAEESPDVECHCTCREPEEGSEEPTPAADQVVVHLPTYYDVNG